MKRGKSVLVFLLTVFLLASRFSGIVLASSPVTISNVQTDSFSGFRNDWSAGSGSFEINGSGGVRLVSTGDQIHLEVPNEAFRGEFEIVVRHGNQFSITTITIAGAVSGWELVGIGVGSSNAVSQVMIGDYRFEQDDDGNPIVIAPPPVDVCDDDCDEDEEEECDEEEPIELPVDDDCEEEEECDEDCDEDCDEEEEPIEELPPVIVPPVTGPSVVEVENEEEYEAYFSILTTNLLPQTSVAATGVISLGGGLLATAALVIKLKKDQ